MTKKRKEFSEPLNQKEKNLIERLYKIRREGYFVDWERVKNAI